MAKVIHTPVIGRNARRSLPIEHTVDRPVSAPMEDGAAPAHSTNPPMIDAQEANRIIAERDAAQQRAVSAETDITLMRDELDKLREEARKVGLEEGKAQAERDAEQRRDVELQEIQQLCGKLIELQTQRIEVAEEAAVEIGFAAITKLLGRLPSDTTLLESLVNQALQQVLARDGLKIYLSTKDCDRMRALAHRASQDWSAIEFIADSRIQLGGCRIENRAGSLDARLELQLAELKKTLLSTMNQRTGGAV